MNLLTILFLSISSVSGSVLLGIGLANLPQPSSSYVQGSGETAETIAEKNRIIVLNSYEFKLTMIGTGLIILAFCVLVWAKSRDERLRILDEERLELRKTREKNAENKNPVQQLVEKKAVNKNPVQQLVEKSAELDSKISQTPVNKHIQSQPPERNVLQIQRLSTYPRPILKNAGYNIQLTKPPYKNPHPYQRNYYPRPYYPRPYYPRPYNTLYPSYNQPVIEYIKY
jgi:hypothetical protein